MKRVEEAFDNDTKLESKKAVKRHDRLEARYGQVAHSCDPALTKFFSNASKDVLHMSKKVVNVTANAAKNAVKETGLVLGMIDKVADDELHFAEFVHMLQSCQLDDLFPSHDWKRSVKDIHALRRAFDTADGKES